MIKDDTCILTLLPVNGSVPNCTVLRYCVD
jgi:hypothetical protein